MNWKNIRKILVRETSHQRQLESTDSSAEILEYLNKSGNAFATLDDTNNNLALNALTKAKCSVNFNTAYATLRTKISVNSPIVSDCRKPSNIIDIGALVKTKLIIVVAGLVNLQLTI